MSLQAMELSISNAREMYRPVAMRGSLIYFLIDSLAALDRVYYYSMANFKYIMVKSMVRNKQPGSRDAFLMHTTIIQIVVCNLY